MEVFSKNPLYVGIKLPVVVKVEPLERRFPQFHPRALGLLKVRMLLATPGSPSARHTLAQRCLKYEPAERATPAELLEDPYFEGCAEFFEQELRKAAFKDKVPLCLC
jgi:hypothetical protein